MQYAWCDYLTENHRDILVYPENMRTCILRRAVLKSLVQKRGFADDLSALIYRAIDVNPALQSLCVSRLLIIWSLVALDSGHQADYDLNILSVCNGGFRDAN